MEKIAPMGWHAVVHFDADRLETLAAIFATLDLPLVIDHMGRVDASKRVKQPAFAMLLDLLEDPKFWVKVCGSKRITRQGATLRRCGSVCPDAGGQVPRSRTLRH